MQRVGGAGGHCRLVFTAPLKHDPEKLQTFRIRSCDQTKILGAKIAIQSERMSLQGCRSHSEVYAGLERRLLDRVLPAARGRKPLDGLTARSVTSPIGWAVLKRDCE